MGDLLCRVFMMIEYYLSWKKFQLSRWSVHALLSDFLGLFEWYLQIML